MNEHRFTNKLTNEKSPYLLQHSNNPVDWYPWRDEAFQKAKKEDKPIFLSIGYSTCHWCHVMERESFEDDEVAELLNDNFVSIKVDREERPDIDHIYMTFCQMVTGHGGWPLTIIMTPRQKPFFAGTYFPKESRMGMLGLMDILQKVKKTWETDRHSLVGAGEVFIEKLSSELGMVGEESEISKDVPDYAYKILQSAFEQSYGGFSTAPKFPTPHNLGFLLRYWKITGEKKALDMVEKTLDGMYRGGIFDHVGFGFSRYSTDKKWLVPHFEKMLYDNALLAIAYLEAYQATQNKDYADVARKIFTYILRDMTSPDGGFYAAEDADSEGEEGKFYVWTVDEINRILGEHDGRIFCHYYGITEKGNFEGRNIPNRIKAGNAEENEEKIEPLRKKVFEYREKRIHPFKDDKILTSWNGLMIAAMAVGGRVLKEEKYTQAAERAVEFIQKKLIREDSRLLARYRDGETDNPAYVDDYAFLVWGLIELYQTTYKPYYLLRAIRMNEDMLKYFWDEENGGLFLYGSDSEQLISRPKEIYDGALPSGNSVAAMNFIRLARLTGHKKLEELGERQLKTFGAAVKQSPSSYTHFLMAALFTLHPTREIVISGQKSSQDTREMITVLHSSFIPNAVSLLNSNDKEAEELLEAVPFIKDQKPVNGRSAAYVCENFACKAPLTDIKELENILKH